MNICVNCKHLTNTDPEGATVAEAGDQYLKCQGFDDGLVSFVDPVTGSTLYVATEWTLGGEQKYHTRDVDKARPRCRSMNPGGKCERFKRR